MFRLRLPFGSSFSLCLLALAGLLFLASPRAWAADATFDERIQPLLTERCAACHDDKTHTSGFSVGSREALLKGGARRGAAVQAGNAQESVLIKSLRGELEPRMPLGGQPLSEDEIGLIAGWIQGLSEEETQAATAEKTWWSFKPPERVSPPAVAGDWAKNDIDRFIAGRLAQDGLSNAPEASARILLRRAYFDLIGLPPTPAEVEAFLADKSPDAYEKLIDRLLADPRYGERWGRHWLDLARYADTRGFEGDPELSHAWRYRDYVINAFNNDKPFDRFLKEQIAGDELGADEGDDDDDDAPRRGATGTPEGQIALGFLRLGPRTPNVSSVEVRQMLLDEVTATAGSVFLGLTLKCAQCHDHKYDPIPQKDFYRFQAFFAPIEFRDERVEFTDAEMKAKMAAQHAEYAAKLKEAQKKLDQYEETMMAKLREVAASQGGADEVKINRQELLRRLIRIDAGNITASQDTTFSEEEKEKYLEILAPVDPRNPTRGKLLRQTARYEPIAHSARNFGASPNSPNRPVTHVLINGEFDKLGEPVEPGFLSVVTGNSEPALLPMRGFGNVSAYRSVLADWMASPENPLTARVMANRIWQHHFGTGIVSTPSDFGRNGARPTHPELLDWLALQFVDKGWSIKAMHRLIMTSATYRQSSVHWSEAAAKVDPENKLLWRMNRLRLEGEIIRDSVLAVSGRLNTERGGPGVFPELPEEVANLKIKNRFVWEPANGAEARKRSIYIMQRRSLQVPFLNAFDSLALNESCERRFVSTTALQSLSLLNGKLVTEESKYFADRVKETAGPSITGQIQLAFQLALARSPEAEELQQAQEYLQTGGDLTGLCRTLLNTNEFIYVR